MFFNFYEKMINRLFITLTISIYYSSFLFSSNTDQLKIFIDAPCCYNQKIRLGYYYGLKTYFKDTISVDQTGKGTYHGSFHEGLFFLVLYDTTIFEFLVTETNDYSIIITPNKHIVNFDIKGNLITEAFDQYNKQVSVLVHVIDSLKTIKKNIACINDSLSIKEIINYNNQKINQLKSAYLSKFKGTLLGNYLLALTPIEIQNFKIQPELQNHDPEKLIVNLKYYQKHYLDNITWNDDRLIYTPVLSEKINKYLDKIVEQKPSSLTSAIDEVLAKIDNEKVRSFILEELMDNFGRSKHKSLYEFVYAYLTENYYLKGYSPWLSDAQITQTAKELDKIKSTLITHIAPEIYLPGKDDKYYTLNEVNAEYTIVFFWNLDCSFCKRIIQDLIFTTSKYSYLDIKVFTVYTGNNIKEWESYVSNKLPQLWINTYETANQKATKSYNITTTPVIYLLNENKIIVEKNLTIMQLDSYLYALATYPKI
jgi:thiol-disulfide isomerase/thioredoxin